MARVKYFNKDSNNWEYADSAYNLAQGNTVEVDTTLSKEGKAADAKAVGESLNRKIPMPVNETGEVKTGEPNQVLTINQDGAGSWEYPLIIDATKTEGYQHVVNKNGKHQELLCIDIAKPLLGIYRMSNYQDSVVYPYVRIVNGDTVLVSSMALGSVAVYYIDVFEVNDKYVQFRDFASNGHCSSYLYDVAENSWTVRKILHAASYVDFNLSQKITTPDTASVGQALAVKAVDENGKPTEWETVDIPEGDTAELFFAVYGETTYAEVTEALDAGKMVYVKYNHYIVPYTATHSSNHWFRLVNEYDMGMTIRVDYNDGWDNETYVYTTNDTLKNFYNKNQVDDLLEGLDTGGSNQPLTFTGAVNATYDGSEAVSVEIPEGGESGEARIYAEEQLATGTISSDSAGQKLKGVFETGLTLGDLKKWKSFVFKLRGAANADPGTSYLRLMNTNYGNDYNAISLVRTSASGVCVVFEWADTARTVLSLVSAFAGTNTYVEDIGKAFAGTENSAWRLAAGETTAAIAGWADLRNCADTQVVAVTKSPAATDYLWEIRGLAK